VYILQSEMALHKVCCYDVALSNDCPFSSGKKIPAIGNRISGCGHLYSYQLSYVLLYYVIMLLKPFV
jgi:hypothetical protein